jgi:hypothetical protein
MRLSITSNRGGGPPKSSSDCQLAGGMSPFRGRAARAGLPARVASPGSPWWFAREAPDRFAGARSLLKAVWRPACWERGGRCAERHPRTRCSHHSEECLMRRGNARDRFAGSLVALRSTDCEPACWSAGRAQRGSTRPSGALLRFAGAEPNRVVAPAASCGLGSSVLGNICSPEWRHRPSDGSSPPFSGQGSRPGLPGCESGSAPNAHASLLAEAAGER